MNIRSIPTLLAVFSLTINLIAQERCAHQACMQQAFGRYPQHRTALEALENQTRISLSRPAGQPQGVITIPVVVHVIYKTSAENISDARIAEQMQVLNEDFRKQNSEAANLPQPWRSLAADAEIAFCLARRTPDGFPTTGIHRVQTQTGFFAPDGKVKYTATGGTDAWDTQHYLNIWICNMGNLVYGYAPYPGGDPAEDGVVLDYHAVGITGTSAPTNKGRTATHEVGHWLNLRHIWGDDAGCDSSDLVADTPNQAWSTSGCPAFPRTDACSPASPGIQFQNYMDYTNDNCMGLFTPGQVARMRALFDPVSGIRREFLNSQGCLEPTAGLSSAQGRVRLSPNPAREVVFVETGETGAPSGIFLLTPEGRVLSAPQDFTLTATGPGQYQLEVSRLSPGPYYLRLQTASGQSLSSLLVLTRF